MDYASSFSESLYRLPPKTLTEIREREAEEIETEEALRQKIVGGKILSISARSNREIKPFRRERTPQRGRSDRKFVPYVAQKRGEGDMGEKVCRMPSFNTTQSEIMEDEEVVGKSNTSLNAEARF